MKRFIFKGNLGGVTYQINSRAQKKYWNKTNRNSFFLFY